MSDDKNVRGVKISTEFCFFFERLSFPKLYYTYSIEDFNEVEDSFGSE